MFTLPHFQGSLDILFSLLQKEEIDICNISIESLIQQFTTQEQSFEKKSAFLSAAAYLVLLKSKTLLPSETNNTEETPIDDESDDPQFALIHHLVDYYRFKQAAQELSYREERQQAHYLRGVALPAWKKPPGIDHVSLDELASLFKEIINKFEKERGQIEEEAWRVGDKIDSLRKELEKNSQIDFSFFLSQAASKNEMIVIFLAILELMKMGEIFVGKIPPSPILFIFPKERESL